MALRLSDFLLLWPPLNEGIEDYNFDEIELSRSMEYQVTQSNDHRLQAAENSYCLDQISCNGSFSIQG